MKAAEDAWNDSNQAYLVAALDRVRTAIENRNGHRSGHGTSRVEEELAAGMARPPAVQRLASMFDLSPFERDVLLLCAGVELDARFADVCRGVEGGRHGPTFSLALAALEEPHWSCLTPVAPLRYWKMIEVGTGEGLATAPLRIDERILHYIAGVSYLDQRLRSTARRWPARDDLPPTHRAIAERISALWSDEAGPVRPVQLCGEEDAGLQDVAAAACERRGLVLHVVQASDLPVVTAEREMLCRLWDRESAIAGTGLLVMVDGADDSDAVRAAVAFVERAQCAPMVGGREPLRLPHGTLPRVDVCKPDSAEQVEQWRQALGPVGERLDGQIKGLVNQFNLGAPGIANASSLVLREQPDDPDAVATLLWATCRAQSRSRLDDLAQRVETRSSWEDLVLPGLQNEILRDIVTHVRQRARVYDDWGFAAKSNRGLGISALFAGASGTGKTLAAEVIANELRLDLYRIDLSQVVSKYIGETEKNLRRVFDAAEAAGAVLLFDEADALFGKRSEVKDSHDRYANIEVGYLLQRMESYRGLAILTTNMKQSLDAAFTRRIRFVVQFPFPDPSQRAEIWQRIFPRETPTNDLDAARLARLNVAGGNIRNIALGAAFLAAEDDQPVGMAHLLRATRAEYAKLERTLTDSEIAGWL